ncbi:hypothetical protein [uncultured Thermanaerothrix sp.]|uniref:hypothetical protein n=1 Tax=uncultured Thermanaerothrix sp. TaxID=1195149 RepID=UPI002631C52A|nr:hypothetical protein [uncultured Thermanaerothrix sp.]
MPSTQPPFNYERVCKETTKLVLTHHDIQAAWVDIDSIPPTLHIIAAPGSNLCASAISFGLPCQIAIHHDKPFRILRLEPYWTNLLSPYQRCQDIPITLGTQIQPAGANWVGTGGIPVHYRTPDGLDRWGLLSNWHVIAQGDERRGRTIHQPTTAYPSFASLDLWESVRPDRINTIDAAIGHAWHKDHHTITLDVLDIGRVHPHFSEAYKGLPVQKVGRSTGLTRGTCIGTKASAKINYGNFIATFEDLDVFAGTNKAFSAPGDSGSGIFNAEHQPIALLFAGNDTLTLGIPIRHIIKRFNLQPLLP